LTTLVDVFRYDFWTREQYPPSPHLEKLMENKEYFDFEPNTDLLIIKKDSRLENNSAEYYRPVKPESYSSFSWEVDALGNLVSVEVPANVELNIKRKIVGQAADGPLGRALLGIEPVETPIFEDLKNR
jgi:hypothetical protein